MHKTSTWYASPWNDEAARERNLRPQVPPRFHDVSLRDGEQQAGIEFTPDEKIRIAEKLAEAGVQRIEAGMPAVSEADAAAVTAIARRDLGGAEVFAFARCMVADIQRAVDSGVRGVVVEIPSSEHIISTAYRWDLERAIDLSIEATLFAKGQGLYVVWFPIDASRAEISWLLRMIERVATEGHMDALAVVDTFGVLHPHACALFTRLLRQRIGKPLEAHFHMDFGLGVANTIVALLEGAEVVHTSVTGIGERAGNTPLEDLVMALTVLYGVDTGIRTEKLKELSDLVTGLAGVPVPPNRAVVGDLLFSVESGIISSWLMNCADEHLTEVFPYRPELVGQRPPRVVLGKGSGIDSIRLWLEELGVRATDDEQLALLQLVKRASLEKKALLTPEEFRDLAGRAVAGARPAGRRGPRKSNTATRRGAS